MNILDLLKNSNLSASFSSPDDPETLKGQNTLFSNSEYADSSSISPDEMPYYKPDNYYQTVPHAGTIWERKVILFEERKKTSWPSKRGLYVAEILLLEYCNYGKYPKPSSGYPGFWWFDYGIRDIGHVLEGLEQRGFIEWAPLAEGLATLKKDELKKILSNASLYSTEKKDELIQRILSVPNISIPANAFKYRLTNLGILELVQNGYVPYMHNHPQKTIEGSKFGKEFNVWSINRLLFERGSSIWVNTIRELELERFGTDIISTTKYANYSTLLDIGIERRL